MSADCNACGVYCSNYDVSHVSEKPSARVGTLQNKWRAVWRMSVDRKKKLQDVLDHLLEVSGSVDASLTS